MPTKNPRINISIEQPLYDLIQLLAHEEGASLSTVARDLIKESLELREGSSLVGLTEDLQKG